jgi:EF hand
MSGMRLVFGRTLAVAALLVGMAVAPAARAAGPSSTDEVRSWSALQKMKAMAVMHMVDADKKGYVTKEEFMKFQEQFFDRMDRDHDGKVTAQEWMGKGGKK